MDFAPQESSLPELGLRYIEAGSGPVVLFLHGWAAFAEIWWGTMRTLAPHYRVVALEWPGHGSTPAGTEISGIGSLAALAARAVTRLELAPVTVVGHSLGGRVAALLALDYPTLVSRLVLVDAALNPSYLSYWGRRLLAPRELRLTHRLSSLLGRGLGPLRPAEHGHSGGIIRPLMRRARYEAMADVDSLRIYLQSLYSEGVEQRLGAITCPALVITGANDPLVSPRQAHKAAELIPGAELAVLPRALHNPMDDSPADFYRVLEGFLERTDAEAQRRKD